MMSIVSWALAIHTVFKQVRFFLGSRKTVGAFARWEKRGVDVKSYWYPVFTYSVPTGETFEVIGNAGTGAVNPPVEPDRSAIRYRPDMPGKAQASSFMHYWLPPIGMSIFAAIVTVAFLDVAGIVDIPGGRAPSW